VKLEPRYAELLRRSREPGGSCRFAFLLEKTEEGGFEVGAKGRVCKMLESEVEPSSSGECVWRVTIEGEAPCRVTELVSEEVERGAAPLFRGTLEELDEDDLGLASSHETESTVTAASEMVDLLGELGRHLQAIRQRWMLTVLMGMTDPGQEGSAGSPWQGLLDSDRQGLESMLGMMSSYRQIIGQMDRLLSDASQSAEEVIDAVEDEDEEEGRLLRDLHRRGRPHGDSGTESAYTSSRRLPASIRDVEHLSESREMTMSDFTAGRPLRSRPSPMSDSSSGQTSSVQAESRLSRLPPQPEVTERRAGTPVSPETDRPRPRPVLGGRLSRLQATGGDLRAGPAVTDQYWPSATQVSGASGAASGGASAGEPQSQGPAARRREIAAGRLTASPPEATTSMRLTQAEALRRRGHALPAAASVLQSGSPARGGDGALRRSRPSISAVLPVPGSRTRQRQAMMSLGS